MVGPGSNDDGEGGQSFPHVPHDQGGLTETDSLAFSQILESNGLLSGSDDGDPNRVQSSRLAALNRLRVVTAADAALTETGMPRHVPPQAGVEPDVLAPRAGGVREQIYGKSPQGNGPTSRPSQMSDILQRNRRSIVLCTLLGGLVGLAMALFATDSYRSASQLVLDPRALRLHDPEFAAKPPTDSNLRVLVSRQIRNIRSEPVLQTVVSGLNLQGDPEFSGEGNGAIAGISSTVRNLLGSGAGTGAVAALASAVSVARDDSDYILNVEVVTSNPAKSAAIANGIVEAYLTLQPKLPQAPASGGDPDRQRQLEDLRLDAQAARQRLQTFAAENGTGRDQRVASLETQLERLRAQKDASRNTALAAAQLDADVLLQDPLPDFVQDTPLVALRAQFEQARQNADSLTTTRAAGDPERVAAEDTAAAIRAEFSRQLRVFISMAQLNLRRQIEREQQLASELAVLKSEPQASPETMMRMRALEQAAGAAQQAFETFRERIPVDDNPAPGNVGTMVPASPAADPVRPSMPVYAATGMGAGLAGGLVIALMAGALRRKRPDLAELARPPVTPNVAPPPVDPDSDPNRRAIEDAWAGLEQQTAQPVAPQPEPEPARHNPTDNAGPPDGDYDAEAEAIRAEIRKMRHMVEQMQEANRRG